MNPLLDFSGLPRFADIRTEHITPAIAQLLNENRALVDRVRADRALPTWDNFVQPMTDTNERLARAWGQVSHLNAVVNNPELREAYNANLPLVTQYYAELAQDQALFEKFFGATPGAPQIYFIPGQEDALHYSFVTRVQCDIIPKLLMQRSFSAMHSNEQGRRSQTLATPQNVEFAC